MQRIGSLFTGARWRKRDADGAVQTQVLNRRVISSRKASSMDWINPLCILGLLAIGMLFLYSAQLHAGTVNWKKHGVGLALGAFVYLGMARTDYKRLLVPSYWLYGLGVLLLLAVLTPLGKEVYGCRRWLNFKFFLLQPSELAKIGTLVLACSLLARTRLGSVSTSFKALGRLLGLVALPVGLIILQPDLGSALVFPPILFALLYTAGVSKRFFLACLLVGFFLLGLVALDMRAYKARRFEGKNSPALLPMKDYQRNRILVFIAPELVDPKGIHVSWNLRQSLICVGSGGFWGKGWTQGTQAKLGYLPQSVAHNDFIFSVLAEEKGLVGGLIVLVLYAILLFNTLRVAALARDRFGLLLATGVSVLFMVHLFVNIGMTLGLMPITGIPLPFISYAVTFLMSCCFLQGIVQSVYRFRRTQSE